MTLFAFEAIDGQGKLRRGAREAADPRTLTDDLLREALTPVRIRVSRNWLRRRASKGLSEAIGAEFAADLSRFIRSGLSVVQALTVLEKAGGGPQLSSLARRVRERVVAGEALSVALEAAEGQTGRLLQTLAKAGETTGRLSEIFEGGAKGLKAASQLKRKMLTLTVYPVFVLIMAFVAMGVFAFAVLPALEPAFQGFRDKLPLQTRIILSASHVFRAGFPIGIALVLAFSAAVALYAPLRRAVLRWIERVSLGKLGGGVVADFVFSGFAQRLAIAMAAGAPLLTAYRVSTAPIGNTPVRLALEGQEAPLREGRRLSDALADVSFTPDVLIRLVKVGEGSGDLARLLAEGSETLAVRAQEKAERLLAVLTPLMVVTIGIFIGLIVIIVFQGLLSITEVVDL